jgi:hypothetical protein
VQHGHGGFPSIWSLELAGWVAYLVAGPAGRGCRARGLAGGCGWFPVGHSADAYALAAITGAFVNPDPRYLQSTGFVLDRGGRVIVSVYSSGAIGRLIPQDVIGLVRYLREQAPAGQ